MNRICIENDTIKNATIDDTISMKKKEVISIMTSEDTDLVLELFNASCSIEFNINGVLNLAIVSKGTLNTKFTYNILELSSLNIIIVNDISNGYSKTIVNLNGSRASVDYTFKTVCKGNEIYDIDVNHNAISTCSNLVNNGVNIKNGKLTFNVNGNIPKYSKNAILNQNNRIVNLTDNVCIIKPNLYIDELDVVANHSAHIGCFSDRELFYLQSRGLSYGASLHLLIKGFLLSNVTNEWAVDVINGIIDSFGGEI